MAFSRAAQPSRIEEVVRSLARKLTAVLAVSVALVLAYLSAALVGSLVPTHPEWNEPHQGVRIFVYSNGVHTGLVLPVRNELQDWTRLVSAKDISDPRYAASSHLLFGWGERNFYLNTPRWSDLDPLVAVRAVVAGRRTLLHIDHIHAPQPGSDMRPLMISGRQYLQLSRQLESYFRLNAMGRTQPLKGYGPSDVFYESSRRYDLFHTCNEWTGAQLRRIGVRIGIWTPFSKSVMIWFDPKGRFR
ncbi:TIGR02117 family protein [Rhizorhapis suberifaciens]|uniref:Uncharacterized protein (TIGR02117 family) n=1 Tax=Rhizorhapis suberifaciens TaxID=13656 RepID=A0A840HR62_9SPHN|nr:TIGR02117 family protein [Rhizorhapis suberifaciens]MBB4640363.1 uncharacterized protein (TIGR02117 family) [Rhizorhapis suberifaciens]